MRLANRGGKDLFLFDDCLVQAWTGFASAISVSLDNMASSGLSGIVGLPGASEGAAAMASRLKGAREKYLTMPPAAILQENKGNRLLRLEDISSATLTGKRMARGVRVLRIQHRDEQVRFAWTGAKVASPVNDDRWAVPLLQHVLGERLTVTL